MTASPLLSVGLPVYNGGAFIDECLRSILEQTFGDFELIVCDNASTDNTAEIVEDWCRRDSRVRLHRSERNLGAARNFNRCFESARGEYFKWCAVDDLLEPECFAKCLASLVHAPEVVLAYPGAIDIDESGAAIGPIYDNDQPHCFDNADPVVRFRDLICLDHSCIAVFGVIRRSALERTSLIGPYPASDRVLLAELGLQGRYIRVPENLLRHRQHRHRSVTANPSLHERMLWFNTAHRGRVFPHFRLLKEYLRAALAAPLPWSDRIRCLREIGRWLSWAGARGLADDARFYLRRPAKTHSQ